MLRLVLMLLIPGVAVAGVDAKLVGTWVGKMTLRIEAGGRCSVDQEVGTCQTLRGALFYKGPNGVVNTYGWKVAGEELTVSGGGQTMVFRRQTDAAPATAAAPTTAAAPAPSTPALGAGRWAHPYLGFNFAIPAGWKVAEREGIVLLGSDTEAGLMVVRFMPTVDRQALLAGYSQGLQEDGVKLMPSSRAEDFPSGIAGELTGMAQDGTRLAARVIGVVTPFGDAAVFLGLTTPEKYAQLKPRVDALAASAAFVKPKIPPANTIVAGQYSYYYSSNLTSVGGSNYSREDNLSLCANGMFRKKGEMSGSQGAAWGVASQSGFAGTWAADGDGQTGSITLTYRNGGTERLRYQKAGLDIVLNGKKYGRFGDGSCAR